MPRVEFSEERVVYKKGKALQTLSLLTGFFLGLGSLYFIYAFTQRSLSAQGIHPLQSLPSLSLIGFFFFGGISVATFMLYGAGPDELVILPKSHSYRFKRGFPLLAPLHQGSWSDFHCLYIMIKKNKNGTFYHLYLGWNGEGYRMQSLFGDGSLSQRRDILLSGGNKLEVVQQEAEELSTLLGKPILPTENPRVEQFTAFQKRMLSPLFNGVLVLLLLMVSLPPMGELYLLRQLEQCGVKTQGTIIDKESGENSNIYLSYWVNGFPYKRSDPVLTSDLSSIRIGDTCEVTYLPEYPRTMITPYSNSRRENGAKLIANGVVLLLCFGSSLFSKFKKKRLGK